MLDGASYSQENLGALQGFSWVMRVPATLKEARALLRKELPQEAWRPLLPGYRGLEVESEYGGVRQRWLLVESQERARLAEEELNRRGARAEGEAQKVLGRLTARTFACEADARRALSEASARLPLHRLVYLGVKEERQWERVGRPRKGEQPLAVVYRLRARLEVDQEKLEEAGRGLGRFLLATNVLDALRLPAAEVLRRYKDQARTVERGFRFLKDPLFFASSTFLKRAERSDEPGDGHGGGPVGLRLGGVGAEAEAGGDGVQPTGSEGQAYPKTHPTLGVPALHLGSLWPCWKTGPWF